jgi:hypothetical protein
MIPCASEQDIMDIYGACQSLDVKHAIALFLQVLNLVASCKKRQFRIGVMIEEHDKIHMFQLNEQELNGICYIRVYSPSDIRIVSQARYGHGQCLLSAHEVYDYLKRRGLTPTLADQQACRTHLKLK